jgi:hypothetical protein
VQVYNLAQTRSEVLAEAQKETDKIFRAAGVEILWQECPCSGVSASTSLMIRIIPQLFRSARARFHNGHLGFAATGKEGGVLATIFLDRVEAITKGGNPSRVLGYAMAHEIGHLLLGQNAHSATGLMRAYWSREDLKMAHRGSARSKSKEEKDNENQSEPESRWSQTESQRNRPEGASVMKCC